MRSSADASNCSDGLWHSTQCLSNEIGAISPPPGCATWQLSHSSLRISFGHASGSTWALWLNFRFGWSVALASPPRSMRANVLASASATTRTLNSGWLVPKSPTLRSSALAALFFRSRWQSVHSSCAWMITPCAPRCSWWQPPHGVRFWWQPPHGVRLITRSGNFATSTWCCTLAWQVRQASSRTAENTDSWQARHSREKFWCGLEISPTFHAWSKIRGITRTCARGSRGSGLALAK